MRNRKLSKENVKAVKVCKAAMKRWSDDISSFVLHPRLYVDNIYETGYIGFSMRKISLKQGDTWRWNKAATIWDHSLTPNTSITFFKLNARSRTKGVVPPQLKVWMFTIETKNANKPTYGIWCERGQDHAEIPPPFNITLEDLSFLRPFVTDQVAKELNWI